MEERDPAATNGREAMKERRRTIVPLREIKRNAENYVEPSLEISNISTVSGFIRRKGRQDLRLARYLTADWV
jgi:hypothetical protein